MRPRADARSARAPSPFKWLVVLLAFALVSLGADEGRQEAKADSKNDEGRQDARVDKKKKSSEPSKAMSFTQPGSVIKGFSAPQFDAQGNLVGRIHSERAIVQPDGRYRVEGIHVQGFKDGQPDYDLTLNSCLYHQDTGLVTSDDVVRLVRTNVSITGQGAVWDVANFRGRLLSNVVMVIGDIEKGIR